LLRVLEAKASGLSLPIIPWERIAPIASSDASVVKMKGLFQSGYANTGCDINLFFKDSNECCCSFVQTKVTDFWRSFVNGLAIFEKSLMNFL